MLAKQEIWNFSDAGKVWVGKYRNSHNLPHWHHNGELIVVEQGSIDVFCEKESYFLTVDEAMFIDGGQVHYMHSRQAETILAVVLFDTSIIKSIAEKKQLACPLMKGRYPLKEVYQRIRAVLTDKKEYYSIEAECEILRLFLQIFRSEPLVDRVKIDRTAESLKELLEDIGERFFEYTFQEAVRFMGMSSAYLSRYFRSATGIPFSEYLNRVKVENAIVLIREKKLSMTEIADQCGFNTVRSFNRVFKEQTGYSPTCLPENYVHEETITTRKQTYNSSTVECELIESSDTNYAPFTVVYKGEELGKNIRTD